MLKRFFLALGLAAGLLSPAHSAGTIPFSLSQQLDQLGKPLANCFFYSIQAGTTSTPQSAYQDSALSIALPNPQRCDAAGRLPQMFLADGSIKVRLTDSAGVTQVVADNIQVIGNSSGGGGGSPVDPTTILATGDMKVTYGTGVLTGFVRANGRTIGSATSGATERANSDTQALFLYLWGADANLAVSTGRGVSAAADWAANKTIALPDARSRGLAGLGDMGNSDNAVFSGATFTSGNSTTLGSLLGAAKHSLVGVNLPTSQVTAENALKTAHTTTLAYQAGASNVTIFDSFTAGTLALPGSGTAMDTQSASILVTLYLKL
jgi:hypothetical protein